MDRTEEALVRLFSSLREELRADPVVGLTLKASARDLTLRIRSVREADDERRPYFAVVVGPAEREGAFRISYKPSGLPLAYCQVTIVDADSTEEVIGLVRGYVEAERRRRTDYQEGD